MGVELRSIQRKFHTLMVEVKPSIRPRFVVWLDERLAEFKIKGEMDLSESLEDPQWIKSYFTSKRDAKAAAILKREAREARGSSGGGSVHPKTEAKSESSNGVAHPSELEGREHTLETDVPKPDLGSALLEETTKETSDPDFQLVEVKQEQLDDDDDMIIVGETVGLPDTQTYASSDNQSRYAGFGSRSTGPFFRKRQRFGAFTQRPTYSAHRYKTHPLTTAASFRSAYRGRPSHTISSQPSTYSSTSFRSDSAVIYPGGSDDSSRVYNPHGDSVFTSYDDSMTYGADESLRIPPHLQVDADQINIAEYAGGSEDDGAMYAQYADESYDSQYIGEETSLQYDEEGNAVIQGEHHCDDTGTEPIPGPSEGGTSQASTAGILFPSHSSHSTFNKRSNKRFNCTTCSKTFTRYASLIRHIKFHHFNTSSFECHICKKQFLTNDSLDGHVNSIHYNRRPHICVCGKGYYSRSNLRSHTKSCSQCMLGYRH